MLLFSQSTLERELARLSISADRARNQHFVPFSTWDKSQTLKEFRGLLCVQCEKGFLTWTVCHIFRILIVKFAAIAQCSYHENRDDWGGTLSSVCGIVNGNVSKAETISVTAQIHREDLWLVGWGFCSWRDNRVGSDLSNVLNSICYLTLKSGTRRTSAPFALLWKAEAAPALEDLSCKAIQLICSQIDKVAHDVHFRLNAALKLPIFSVVGCFFFFLVCSVYSNVSAAIWTWFRDVKMLHVAAYVCYFCCWLICGGTWMM